MIKLGVNIDHIATIRNARGEDHPNIIKAAKYVSNCGADIITIHRREDERHINRKDVIKLNCEHLIHKKCWEQWNQQNKKTCPICRAEQ